MWGVGCGLRGVGREAAAWWGIGVRVGVLGWIAVRRGVLPARGGRRAGARGQGLRPRARERSAPPGRGPGRARGLGPGCSAVPPGPVRSGPSRRCRAAGPEPSTGRWRIVSRAPPTSTNGCGGAPDWAGRRPDGAPGAATWRDVARHRPHRHPCPGPRPRSHRGRGRPPRLQPSSRRRPQTHRDLRHRPHRGQNSPHQSHLHRHPPHSPCRYRRPRSRTRLRQGPRRPPHRRRPDPPYQRRRRRLRPHPHRDPRSPPRPPRGSPRPVAGSRAGTVGSTGRPRLHLELHRQTPGSSLYRSRTPRGLQRTTGRESLSPALRSQWQSPWPYGAPGPGRGQESRCRGRPAPTPAIPIGTHSTARTVSGTVQPPVASCSAPSRNGPEAASR